MRPSIYGGIPQRDDLRPLTEALHARDCDRVQRELQERLAPLPPRRLPGGVHAWARVRFDEMELAAWEKRDQGEE